MQQIVLTLDLGTTGNKALAFDRSGAIVAQHYQAFSQHFPHPGWVEQDPIDIWTSTQAVLNKVINQIGINNVRCMGITNQRETTIIWDKHTGKPVYPAIVWQCRRTSKRCQELIEHKQTIQQKTGLFLDPYFSATKIEWIFNNNPALKAQCNKGNLLFGTVDTWVVWNLTKGHSHITDVSNASRTMLFNIHTCKYDHDLLNLFNVPGSLLPTVCESNGNLAKVDASLFGKEIPITAIIGDQQAALFSQCGSNQNAIKNTYGTGLFVMANTGSRCVDTPNLVSTIAWKKEGQLSYALEGSIFIGGSLIQWLRDGLGIIKDASETEAMAASLTHNDGVYIIPALSGLGAPHWCPDARGSILGLTRGTTKNHIARAALESLAYQTRDVIEAIYQYVPDHTYRALRVDGGAVGNKWLMQFQSNCLQLPVQCPQITETTAFGAATLAGLAINFWNDSELRILNPIKTTYSPSIVKSMDQDYKKWSQLVLATTQI